jgi:hypothetical protein
VNNSKSYIFNFYAKLPELSVISFNIMILIRISLISIGEGINSWHIKRLYLTYWSNITFMGLIGFLVLDFALTL